MSAHSPSDEILIVGGGIAGLAFALALHRRGLKCRILEQAPAISEIGAGLLLSPNACRVLQSLGVMNALKERSCVVPRWLVLNTEGETLQNLNPHSSRKDLSVSTRRSDLQSVLLEALPTEWMCSGWKAHSYEDSYGGALVRSTEGKTHCARLIVAADGSHSAAADSRLHPQGYVGWRALVDDVPDRWKNGCVSETWGQGMRFGIAAVNDRQCYWYASANSEPGRAPTAEQTHSKLLRRFEDWHDPIPSMIHRTPPEQILRHDIADAIPNWKEPGFRRVVKIGDAAHPMTPNLGQGAALALEDAWELAAFIATGRDLTTSIQRFHHQRKWRVMKIWLASRLLGEAIQCEHPRLNKVRDLLAQWTPDGLASWSLRRLLAFHPTSPTMLRV